jgi:hypothetical protein
LRTRISCCRSAIEWSFRAVKFCKARARAASAIASISQSFSLFLQIVACFLNWYH